MEMEMEMGMEHIVDCIRACFSMDFFGKELRLLVASLRRSSVGLDWIEMDVLFVEGR